MAYVDFMSASVPEDEYLSVSEYKTNQYQTIPDGLMSKLNTVGGRTERSLTIAPGIWRHWLTLAMRHQNQLLLPCLLVSRGACFSCLGTQNVSPFSRPNKEHMWSKSWRAGSRLRACMHLCSGGLSDQTVGACRPVSLFHIRAQWHHLVCAMNLSL